MYELTINTDTFFLTNSFYYDKACEHPCPTIVPLVQGLAGTLRVHFVGELSPEASDSCLFAIRPYRGVDDLYRTEYAEGATDEDGDVYFDIDLNVSTAELVGALTGREVLDVKAGFVVVNNDQSVRREFQSASTISKTVLAQNETAPLPRATAQSEADYYAGKYVSEWFWGSEFQSEIEKAVCVWGSQVDANIKCLCTTVGQIDKNYEALSSDVDTGFANAKTCREQLANDVYLCIASTVETIAGTYATKEELSSVDTKVDSNTSAIAEETARATGVESSLETSIETNASNIEVNATAIESLKGQMETDEVAISQNKSNIEALQTSLEEEVANRESADEALQSAIDTNAVAIQAEEARAKEAEENLTASVASVETTATQALSEAQSASQKADENANTIEVVQAQIESDEVAIQSNASAISSLQTQLDTDETAIQTNATAIANLQSASGNYVTLTGDQYIAGAKTFGESVTFCGKIEARTSSTIELNVTGQASIQGGASVLIGATGTPAVGTDTGVYIGGAKDVVYISGSKASYNGGEIATLCDLEDYAKACNLSNFVTLDSEQTITGVKQFAGHTYFAANQFVAYDCGLVKYYGEEILKKSDVDTKNYVTLDGEQTISAMKYFTRGIAFGTTTEIDIETAQGHAGMYGCWLLNDEKIAVKSDLANLVDTSSSQTIEGVKTFTSGANFGPNRNFVIYSCGIANYNNKELATLSDVETEKMCRQTADANLQGQIDVITSQGAVGALLACDNTWTGTNNFTRNFSISTASGDDAFFSANVSTKIISVGASGANATIDIYGSATYNGNEIATTNAFDEYVKLSTLSTGQFTVSGEWHFDGEVQMSNNNYSIDLQEGMLGGTWNMMGKTLATTSDIPDMSDYVSLKCEQTILGQKVFKAPIGVNSTVNTIQDCAGEANLIGCWRLNGEKFTAGNYVTLDTCQTVTSQKKFNCIVTFGGNNTEFRIQPGESYASMYGCWRINGHRFATTDDLPCTAYMVTTNVSQEIEATKTFLCKVGFGSTEFNITPSSDFANMLGCWRLKGAMITTRDITDALDARITALEEKLG